MKCKLIPNWQEKKLRCHLCGETRSVKYTATIFDPVVDRYKATDVYICNKCATYYKEKVAL